VSNPSKQSVLWIQSPLPGTGTLALPGRLISSFLRILYLSLPGLLTFSVFLQAPRFQWSGKPSGAAELTAFPGAGGRPAGTAAASGDVTPLAPAPEEAGWITGYAVNADGGHAHH
jgi:hypothetical protein